MYHKTEYEQAKRNFLARMSHEMRTPLNAIIGMSTIAQATHDIEKIAQCLVKINEASEHLLGMIDDILDLAKIEAGNLKLAYSEFYLPLMLQKLIGTKKFTLDAKRQNFILDLDPSLPETIVSDEQKLSQVLDSFLSNAIKFTPPQGTIALSVKKLKEEHNCCTLGIKVSDNGIGISAEGMKKIFSLFEQVDGSLGRKYEGAGMGLRIASCIVRLMGGKIKVDSKPGKGSAFGFAITVERGILKARDNFPCAGTDGDQTAAHNIGGKPRFSGKTIILAEDVEINREIVMSILEDTGIAIASAENGLEALEMYKASPEKYDLILMDIHMPKMDGLEAARHVRAFEAELPNNIAKQPIPIIAMTANVFKDDVEKCLAAGMTSHLGKPVDFKELMRELGKFLL